MSGTDMAAYMRNRRRERRERLLAYRGGECFECGALEELEFNHRDRSAKTLTLSGKGLDGRWENLVIEAEKCDVLCKPCHRDYTASQWSNGEIVPWNKGVRGAHVHGTARTYQETGCRCQDCRYAKRLYRAGEITTSQVVAVERIGLP